LTTIDHWSTMHPFQLKSPVDLSTNLAGQLPRFPAIFFVLARVIAWLGASDWPGRASGPTIRSQVAQQG
jgi:hypothetical protein